MREDTVRIHPHTDPEAPGTRWWPESDLGFTGGADALSDLVAAVQEWAEIEKIDVSFVIDMEEDQFQDLRSGSADRVVCVISRGREVFEESMTEGGQETRLHRSQIQVPSLT